MRLFAASAAAAVAALFGGFAAGYEPAAQAGTTPTRTWPKPWTVVVDTDMPAGIIDKIDDAFLAGFDVSDLPCESAIVATVDDPDNRSWASVGEGGTDCVIGLDIDALEANDWYTDYSVYHEVAHLFAQDGHGPMFRQVEAHLLGQVGIVPLYLSDGEYPDGFLLADGSCYGVCG